MSEVKNKKIKYLIISSFSLFVIALIALAIWNTNINKDPIIEFLPKPILKELSETSGSKIVVQGTGYPEAKILVYVNEGYNQSVEADSKGDFFIELNFQEEDIFTIKAKQTIQNVESEFSNQIQTTIDLTPPNPETLVLTTEFPKQMNSKEFTIQGSISPEDNLLINNKAYEVGSDGKFSIAYTLSEGNNIIIFKLEDEYGNKTDEIVKHTIYIDTIPPKLNAYYEAWSAGDIKTEEYVNLHIGDWTGYLDATNSVPIVGTVKGDVASITVDGKNISWDTNGEIYQRINLFIRGGLNKYKVIVKDKLGNETTGYIETTAARDKDSLDINLYNY